MPPTNWITSQKPSCLRHFADLAFGMLAWKSALGPGSGKEDSMQRRRLTLKEVSLSPHSQASRPESAGCLRVCVCVCARMRVLVPFGPCSGPPGSRDGKWIRCRRIVGHIEGEEEVGVEQVASLHLRCHGIALCSASAKARERHRQQTLTARRRNPWMNFTAWQAKSTSSTNFNDVGHGSGFQLKCVMNQEQVRERAKVKRNKIRERKRARRKRRRPAKSQHKATARTSAQSSFKRKTDWAQAG